jgi:hypothetical protein
MVRLEPGLNVDEFIARIVTWCMLYEESIGSQAVRTAPCPEKGARRQSAWAAFVTSAPNSAKMG